MVPARRAQPSARSTTRRPASTRRRTSHPSSVERRCATTKVVRPLHQALDGLHHVGLGLRVQRARRLVEQEQRRVLEERAREREPLALAARQGEAALADDGLVALRQAQHELVGAGRAGGGLDVGEGGLGAAVGDVLADRGGEEDGLLQDDRELRAQVGEAVVAQVHAVEADDARGRVVEAREEAEERGLARAARAGDADAAARGDRRGGVREDGAPARVRVDDVLEGDVAGGPGERPCARALGHVDGGVEEAEDAVERGEALLDAGGAAAHGLEGVVELGEVGHHLDQLARRERAGLDVARAEVEHRRRAHGQDDADEQPQEALDAHGGHLGPHAGVAPRDVAAVLVVLLAERLHDAERAQRLGHDGHGGALALAHLGPLAAEAPAEHGEDAEEHRRRGDGHQRQDEVDGPRDEQDHHELRRGADHGDEPVDEHVLDGGAVVLDAVDGLGAAARVVVGERQPLQVPEDARPQAEGEAVAEPHLEHPRREHLHLHQQRDRDDAADRQPQQAVLRTEDRVGDEPREEGRERLPARDLVEHDRDGDRQEQRERRREQRDAEQPREPSPAGPRLAQRAPERRRGGAARCVGRCGGGGVRHARIVRPRSRVREARSPSSGGASRGRRVG